MHIIISHEIDYNESVIITSEETPNRCEEALLTDYNDGEIITDLE